MPLVGSFSLSLIFGISVGFIFLEKVSFNFWVILFSGSLTLLTFYRTNHKKTIGKYLVIFYLLGLLIGGSKYQLAGNFLKSASRFQFLDGARQGIAELIKRDLPSPQSSLAYGFLFGSNSKELDKDFLRDLRRTGTSHMVAVSGYNVSVIINVLTGILFLASNKLYFLLGLAGLGVYDLLVGLSASVVRATIMGIYLFLGGLLGRQRNLDDALLFSAALMLVLDPGFLVDLGFQLSFLSMVGVVYLSPLFSRLLAFIPRNIREVISATLSSQVAVLPISVYNFGLVSFISPVANVLTFVTIPTSMALTSLEVLLGPLSPGFSKLVSIPNFVLLTYFARVIRMLSSLRWCCLSI